MMQKDHFYKEIDPMDVPEKEVYQAIRQGLVRGREEVKRSQSKWRLKIAGSLSVAVIIIFLLAGFVFAPISYALSHVPLLGMVYDKLGLQIGYQLLESDLVTELNQSASSNGIDMTITSAYYDENIVGLTFRAEGDRVKLGGSEAETDYSYHIFDESDQSEWSATLTPLQETTDGYTGAIEWMPPAESSAWSSIPLTFTDITGVKGEWHFDVPLTYYPSEELTIDSSYELAEGYRLDMEMIANGKVTSTFYYTSMVPNEMDEVRLTVFDDKGERFMKALVEPLATEVEGESIRQETRELFRSAISEEAAYLEIHPVIVQDEVDTVVSLDQALPFTAESNRFDYGIMIKDIQQKENTLTMDYELEQATNVKRDFTDNFARFIQLIHQDHMVTGENGEIDKQETLGHTILSEETRLIEKNTLHYRSTFTLPDEAYQDYLITIPFGTLQSNAEQQHLDPIRIELPE